MDNTLVVAVVAAVGTGIVSTLGTVAALKVHISYITQTMIRLEKSIERAHTRIDEHDRTLYHRNPEAP
ncbi:MAG: hypothetical protein GYB58_05650 [Gammaproteobacteria bacterium]|nr:hypothetical protein [Gammaproteobacteria bacterium]